MRKKDRRNCSPFESRSKLPSLDVPEYTQCWCANYTHKIGADANLIENSRCDLPEDIANDLHHHKTPKVRLMATMKSDTIVAPMDKSIKISQKKRNMFQENGRRFGMNNIDGDNGFDGEKFCLQSGRESVNIKHTSKKDSGVSRRKHNQQAQVVTGCSLQILLEGKNSDLDTSGSGANVFIQSSHASLSIEKVQCHLRNNNKSFHTKKHSDLNNLLEDTHASSHKNVISQPENEETSLPENEINLNEVQNHSNVAIPQSNQQPMKPMETGQSTYVPTMDQGACLGSQEKKRKAHALEQLGGRKLQQPAFSTDLLNTTRDFDVGGYSTPATVLPIISIPKKDPPCLFNQNPADIADADDKRYFRTVEHQRIRDKSSIAGYSGVDVKLDDRQKTRRKERLGRMSIVGLKR
ncbi:hypothetical protein KY285_022260 [Solanum tuberosum]|nr:hypothetical protein KY285_022260 [Solanum tuberosum]